MEVRILGPLEVWVDGRPLELGAGRLRALVALLVLNRNRVMSSDRLIDELWGDQPPITAAKGLQNLVVQLRRTLSPSLDDVVVTQSPGYVLQLADDAVDAHRFERLARDGGQLVESDPAEAARRLDEALSLWTGGALADFAYEQFAQEEIARLEELRLGATEDRFDAQLALGRAAELVPALDALVARQPERERLRAQLMLALYRSGRQAEALDSYRDLRTRLREELGLEPSAALRQLEQAILAQDPSLGPAPRLPTAPSRKRRRRRWAFVAAAALLAGAAAALATVLRTRVHEGPVVVPNSIVKIDAPRNEIVDVIRVGKDPGQIAVVGDFVFVVGQQDGTLSRVHRRTGETTTTGRYDATGSIDGAQDGSLWVASVTRHSVSTVDAASLDSLGQISLSADRNLLLSLVEVGGGSLWVSEWFPPAVSRWDLRRQERVSRYLLPDPEYPLEVAFGQGAAWVALWTGNLLLRIDAVSGRRTEIEVGNGPRDPAIGFGSVWVAMSNDGTVWRVDPRSGKPRAVVDVGRTPWGVAVGDGSVWVTNNCDGTVSRIDPDSNEVVATIQTGFFPQWLAADPDHVWVGVSDTGSAVPGSGPNTNVLQGCAS